MLLEDAESYFTELRLVQVQAVKRYWIYAAVLLFTGVILLFSTLVWAFLTRDPSDKMTDIIIKVAIPFGCGVISAIATVVPVKEITNRKEKIKTYDRLLAITARVKAEQKKYQKDLKEILERMNSIIEALATGC